MSLEINHIFIAVSEGAPEIEALKKKGFAEGPPNTHPGQGTASRRILLTTPIWSSFGSLTPPKSEGQKFKPPASPSEPIRPRVHAPSDWVLVSEGTPPQTSHLEPGPTGPPTFRGTM